MALVLVGLNWELKMGFPSFLLSFFIVFHLLLSSGSSCPSSFDCGHLDPIKFPFTNDTYPQCGLCQLRCRGPVPEVVLGEEETSYQVISIHDDTLKISDPWLRVRIESQDCNFSRYIIPPNTPSISFTISTNLTFFKCNTNGLAIDDPKYEHFFDNYTSYTGCTGYTVHYLYPNNTVPAPGSYPQNCVFFQLPVVSASPVEFKKWRNLFSILTSDISVEYHVPEERVVAVRSHLRLRWRLILGIAVPTAAIMVILLFCVIFKKHAQTESTFFWKTKTESYENIKAFLRTCGSLSPIQYTYSDIKKITKSFRTKLGQGGFGTVFKGELENGSLVAVKVLKGSKGNGDEFINEVATISRTSHVNIVTLRGFCFEGSHRALIYDFMCNGSLDKFIRDGDSLTCRKLGWEALYQIVVGIARGLEYLHRGCNARIVHFDIKPHNILLDEDFCPKISDFGLAKLCLQKESIISLLGARGTTGYIAPEVFCRNFGGVSHKSDVYSYGMMVLEMVGARKNPSVEVDRSSEIYFPHWVYKRLELDEELGFHGVVDDEANGTVRKMIIVGLWCIQTDPSIRPSISQVVEMLEGSPESLLIPPKPFLSSPSRAPVDSFTTHVMTLRQCMHASTG